MITHPLIRLTALATLLAVPLSASATDEQLYNPDPNKCDNVIITINGNPPTNTSNAKPPIDVVKPLDGNYPFTLKVDVNPPAGHTVTITSIKLESVPPAASVDVSGPITTPYSGEASISHAKAAIGGTNWRVVVQTESTTTDSPTNTTTANDPCIKKFTLGSGDCTSCSAGAGSTCSNSASSGSFTYDMPLGRSDGGDTDGSLRFHTPDMSFPGLEGISVFVPTSFPVERKTDLDSDPDLDRITVTTPTTVIVAEPTTGVADSITITHTLTDAEQPFRTTIISKVTVGTVTYLRADSSLLADGQIISTFRHQQKKEGNIYTIESGSFTTSFTSLREEDLTITPDTEHGTEVHREIVRENGVPVSDIETTWTNFAWGWEKTQEIIDPPAFDKVNPGNLISTWTYYDGSKGTGPPETGDAGSQEGYGRLETHVRYDGYMETNYYWYNNHTTILPFAGAQQGLTLSREWDSGHTTLTTTRKIGEITLSNESVNYNGSTITSTTGTLSTVTTLMPSGADGRFGGQPASISHPDGTLTTYGYTRHTGGGKTVVMTTVAASNGSVTLGKQTTTTYNRYGTIIRQITQSVGYSPNITLDHYAVTSVDDYGRPFITAYFPGTSVVIEGNDYASTTDTPAWTTSTSYSCCGVESTTDRHGVSTTYEYDGLHRQISSTTLGVATETVHNGLTTTTKRGGLVVAVSESNLAGTEIKNWSPSPQTGAMPSQLLSTNTTSTNTTTYAGVLTSVVTTAGTQTQTTLSYPDGRTWKTYGDFAPAVEHAYAVNTTGLISANGYSDGGTVKEITATQTDEAGRTVVTGRLPNMLLVTLLNANSAAPTRTFTNDILLSYNSNGQLEAVKDADGVVTLYGYNGLGERVATALNMGDVAKATTPAIDYDGTDQVTVTETAPFTRPGGPTVMRSTTTVYATDGSADHIEVSTSDRTADGSETWTSKDGSTETHTSSATVTTIGLNFSDGSETTLVSDAPAEGFANWTDSWLVRDGSTVRNLFQNGTEAALVNGGSIRVSWQSSNTGAAGSEANNEQALYRGCLDDGQTDPTNPDLGGSSSDGIGVRVKITGLTAWLAAHGHTAYQIRAYSSSDSGDATFQPITIHDGNATGTSLGTIAPAVMGQADYPTGFGGEAKPRGYGDSPETLTSDTITLTIPVGTTTPAIMCGNLAAIKITGLGIATTPVTSTPNGSWAETTVGPDQTRTVTTYSGGRPLTATRYGSDNAFVSTVTYGFDSLGRPAYTIDSRTGLTTTDYISNICDMVASVTDPAGRTSSFTYDSRGNRLTTIYPDNSVTYNRYNSKNQLEATWGSLAYATVYSYDYAWRRLTLGTSPTIEGSAPVNNTGILTYWQYSPDTGLLTGKFYDSKEGNLADGPTYTHTAAGRLQSRAWKRGVTTDYYYNQGGQLRAVNYSDATPDVLYNRDRMGRTKTATQGTASMAANIPAVGNGTITIATPIRSATYTYSSPGDLAPDSETLTYGTFTKTIDRYRDTQDRPLSLVIGTEYATAYGFDTAGRLKNVWDHPTLNNDHAPTGNADFTYGYVNNSNGLVQTVAGPAHTVTNTWETTRDVLATKTNTAIDATTPSSFAYSVNSIGQRKTVSPVMVSNQPVSTYTPKWAWDYNDQGELVEANDQAGSNDRAYQFDAIGNREKTVNGLLGNLPVTPNYAANPLNQYTKANGFSLPTTPIPGPYDLDGNLRFDGGVNKDSEDREYIWDAENRLIAINSVTHDEEGDITATTGLVTYQYDHLSRMISRTTTTDAVPEGAATTHCLYDGFNLIAEYTGTTLTKTYVWGMDLSGSMQGAGGVGGLLVVSEHTMNGVTHVRTPFYPTFDGNSNVCEYLQKSGNSVTVVAHYEYDAFGNDVTPIGQGGGKHNNFAHRFSTKPYDLVSGWYNYTYRYYDPLTGRWPSRDPIGENSFFVQYVRGQSRLQIQILTEMSKKPAYLFAANDGVNNSDFLGLAYFAYRPLTGVLSGLGVCGNSADDACNTYIAHEQLFFEDKKTPPNQGFFDDSTVREDRAENLGNYQAAHDSGWNDCVMRKAVAAVPAGTYCLLGAIGSTEKNNCQDWAEAVRQKYKSLIKDANTVSECCPTQAEKNK